MRILVLSEDPKILGGIPRYSVPVAERLAARGHDVAYVFPGGYSDRYDWTFRRRWTRSRSNGVAYHGLVNPSSIGVNLGRPEADVRSPDTEAYVRLARRLRPDVVHVHSFLGLPVEVVERLAALAPVFVTVHEFGLICQRRVLVQRDGALCGTYPTQVDCAWCVDRVSPARHKMRARLASGPGGLMLKALHAAERVAGTELTVYDDDESHHRASPEETEPFRRRLADSVGIVNASAARVFAVSGFVRDVLLECGFRADKVDVQYIGSASAESLSRLPLPIDGGGDVTFGYMSGVVANKGPTVLMDALRLTGRSPKVIVAGSGDAALIERLRSEAPANVEFFGPFDAKTRVDVLARTDVLVAPAVGPDTSPQVVWEALAAGRPVIGSRLGGIPDFVTDEWNGLLVPPGDAEALAAAMMRVMDDHGLVRRLAANAALPRTVDQHVDDLEAAYARVA